MSLQISCNRASFALHWALVQNLGIHWICYFYGARELFFKLHLWRDIFREKLCFLHWETSSKQDLFVFVLVKAKMLFIKDLFNMMKIQPKLQF